MSLQSKGFCFTINNPTEDDEQAIGDLSEDDRVSYLIVGKETGESGTPHFQGWVYFKAKIRWSIVHALIPRAHLEASRGSPQQNIDYCSKDGDFTEYGSRPVQNQGRRTDIDACIGWLDGFIEEHGRAPYEREVARGCPTAFLKYRNFMQLAALRAPDCILQAGEARDWQLALESALATPCSTDRDILFYVDSAGGSGKSWFTRYFYSKYPDKTQILQPGGFGDMAYALDSSKSVFLINVARGGMEFLQYRFLESLKDKMVFSSKYDSRMKILTETPHVVVFSNEQPDMTKLTSDRYNIINL